MDTAHNHIQTIRSQLNATKGELDTLMAMILDLQKRNSKLSTNNRKLLEAMGLSEFATNTQIEERKKVLKDINDQSGALQALGVMHGLVNNLNARISTLEVEPEKVKKDLEYASQTLTEIRLALNLHPGQNVVTEAERLYSHVAKLTEANGRQSKVLGELLDIFPSLQELYHGIDEIPQKVKDLMRLVEQRNWFTQRIALLEDKVRRQEQELKDKPKKGEVFVEANAYAKLLRDSQDLEVIKQKLGIDSI